MNKIIRDYEIAIKLLEAQNKHLSNKIQQLEANQHMWYSPKDNPPNVPEFFAITKFDPNIRVYRKNETDQHYTTEWLNIRNDILYWMPIPDVPREVNT